MTSGWVCSTSGKRPSITARRPFPSSKRFRFQHPPSVGRCNHASNRGTLSRRSCGGRHSPSYGCLRKRAAPPRARPISTRVNHADSLRMSSFGDATAEHTRLRMRKSGVMANCYVGFILPTFTLPQAVARLEHNFHLRRNRQSMSPFRPNSVRVRSASTRNSDRVVTEPGW